MQNSSADHVSDHLPLIGELFRMWIDRCRVVIVAMLALQAAGHTAELAVCRDIERKFDIGKAAITSIELNGMLFSAADKGCEAFAGRLLAEGASLEARDREGTMALARAARSGHPALVALFLDHGAALDARNIAGSTALYGAAEHDRLAVVSLLLDKGANPNLPGRSGVTPIAAAAFRGNTGAVDALLAHGADATIADQSGKAPIVYASALGFTTVVRRLLAAGIDVNARYGNQLTALMWAAGHGDGAGLRDIEAVIDLLIERGARIDDADNRGRTALMIAAENGHADIVDRLVLHGADRTRRDRDGRSALELAANDSVRERLVAR